MKLSTKATLFSSIIFPGAGYFVLDRYKQGLAFIVATLAGLGVIFYDAWHKAQILAEKILLGDIAFDIAIIRERIALLPDTVDSKLLTAIYCAIILLWLIGIIDSYRTGRAREQTPKGEPV